MLPESEVLEKLFSRHGVRFAYLFGSRSRGQERPGSDCDIACCYDEPDCYVRFQQHCALHLELQKLLNHPLDLIILNDAKPVLQAESVLKGQLLYPSPNEVVRFESRIRQRHEDYAYSQRFFVKALGKRLANR